tara:strand:- start:2354 stop:2617 length:264 start_codon:yes stop_codon:yes gene_type:complete
MNSTVEELQTICRHNMQRIDDFQQVAHELDKPKYVQDYFTGAYDILDEMHRKFNPVRVSQHTRNYIRMFCKDVMKRGYQLESEQIVS